MHGRKIARKINDQIEIICPYTTTTYMRIKTLEKRKYNPIRRIWECSPTEKNIIKLQDWGFQLIGFEKEIIKKNEIKISIPKMKKELTSFQKEGVQFLEDRNGRAILGDDRRIGKTVQTLTWIAKHPEIRPIIIVCPGSLKLNWKKEILNWMFNPPSIAICEGEKNEFESIKNKSIIICNYEILHHWMASLQRLKAKLLVIDECHFCKNPTAIRTRAVLELGTGVKTEFKIIKKEPIPRTSIFKTQKKKIEIITGTPIPHIIPQSGTLIKNKPKEAFPILNLIDPKTFSNFFQFGKRYCNGHKTFFGWDFEGSSNLDELNSKLKKIMIRRLKKDVIADYPKEILSVIPLDINNREEYDKASSDFITWLKTIDIEKANRLEKVEALVRIEFLKQLALKGKIKAAMQWIEDFLESERNLIVFFSHNLRGPCKQEIKTILRKFRSISLNSFTAKTTQDRDIAKDRFQSDPDYKIFFASYIRDGIGVSFSKADSAAFMELPMTPGDVLQAQDRIYEINKKTDQLDFYYLIADNTIEEDIMILLDSKRKILDSVLDGVETNQNVLLTDLLKKLKTKN